MEVVASSTNGADALEILKQTEVDAVFTDIRMPLMDGLTLIREIRRTNPETLIVIITGYNDFSYAQEAIKYHVVDFMLKPLSYDNLYQVTKKVVDILQNRYYQNTREKLWRALAGYPIEQNDTRAPFIYLLKVGNFRTESVLYEDNQQKTDAVEKIVFQWMKTYFPEPDNWWAINMIEEGYIFLATERYAPKLRRELFDFLQESYSGLFFTLCEYPKPVFWKKVYEVKNMLCFDIEAHFLPFCSQEWIWGKYGKEKKLPITGQEEKEKLFYYFKTEQTEKIEKFWDGYIELLGTGVYSQCDIEKDIGNIISFLAEKLTLEEKALECTGEMLARVFRISESEEDFTKKIREFLSCYTGKVLHNSGYSGIILYNKIKSYIELSYKEPINLIEMSEMFHVSPSYISRLFKKYGNQSPIQYLIWFRMRKACELLCENPDMNIRSVSEFVGYEDQHHFSKYFKKIFGLPPKEYVEKVMMNKEKEQ